VGRPYVSSHRFRKSTLLALSWAIEDQFCSRAESPVLFAGFQHERYWRPARRRWEQLAHIARSAMVFADFDTANPGDSPVRVPLPVGAALRQEWIVICDSFELPAVLAAWEIPGQDMVPEPDRIFETIWTIDPEAVRAASRICAQLALDAGIDEARPLLYQLAENPTPGALSPAEASELFSRIMAYLDRFGNSPTTSP